MDEFAAELRARKLVREVAPTAIPCPVEAYVEYVGAKLKTEDLPANEPGYTMELRGKHHIAVNANDSSERQRFTACHELGHIVLDVPSEHGEDAWWSYRGRPPNEKYCDVFAAELLLPYTLFRQEVVRCDPGFSDLQEMANWFNASLTATGSRFASLAPLPCAFVISEAGHVRYASRSPTLRETGAWIQPRSPLPSSSVSARARAGCPDSGSHEVDPDQWFTDWTRGGVLLEEARHLAQWDQTLTMLWFEEDDLPPASSNPSDPDEEAGLTELDGILPWPDKSRRR